MNKKELYKALNELADTLDYAQSVIYETKSAERALSKVDDIIEEVYGSLRELAQKVRKNETANT